MEPTEAIRAGEIGPIRREIVFEPVPDRVLPIEEPTVKPAPPVEPVPAPRPRRRPRPGPGLAAWVPHLAIVEPSSGPP
jgi:hypothetical protein